MISNLRKLQLIELIILKKFVEICEEFDLQYFLIGGTALGAVRHSGFIPWDDDIDVGMPRTDYEKFLKVAQEKLNPEYFLQSIDTDKNYVYSFIKIRKNNTVLKQKNFENIAIHQGISIDVFPLDGCGNNYKKARKHYKKIKVLNYIIMSPALVNSQKNKSFPYKVKLSSLKIVYKFSNREKLINRLNKLLNKYSIENSQFVANLLGSAHEKEIMEKDVIFGNYNKLKFEDGDFCVPSKMHDYLASIYGDYMTVPDDKEINNRHEIIEIIY
jgi:lipopolysaccharide cholinephosphotransferase